MNIKQCSFTFDYYDKDGSGAFTLPPECIENSKEFKGWVIKGDIQEDHYEWVNEFEATKDDMRVWGDFEKTIYSNSIEALNNFMKSCPPEEWDYHDI
jgi:hypothetical protein